MKKFKAFYSIEDNYSSIIVGAETLQEANELFEEYEKLFNCELETEIEEYKGQYPVNWDADTLATYKS